MKINRKITITTLLKAQAESLRHVTVGETELENGSIRIYARNIQHRAKILSLRLPDYSIKQIAIDLYYLVLFHEFHHAIVGHKSTENLADTFAWDCFISMFKRETIIPRKLWRNLPMK